MGYLDWGCLGEFGYMWGESGEGWGCLQVRVP